jgi:hypothetical protein
VHSSHSTRFASAHFPKLTGRIGRQPRRSPPWRGQKDRPQRSQAVSVGASH